MIFDAKEREAMKDQKILEVLRVVESVLSGRFVSEPVKLGIPQVTQASIESYARRGIPPGGFLRAVLMNDLAQACWLADHQNGPALRAIVTEMFSVVPPIALGSDDAIKLWGEAHRLYAKGIRADGAYFKVVGGDGCSLMTAIDSITLAMTYVK